MTILKRRHPRTRGQHIREALWPSMGLVRLGKYYKHRVGRLSGTPRDIASGFAMGVAISFTPLVGLHTVVGGVLTWLLRGSIVAFLLAELLVANPWTYPFIWLSTYKLGQRMLGEKTTAAASHVLRNHQHTFQDLLAHFKELFLPMTLGCIPLAIAGWVVSYYVVYDVVKRSKDARVRRIHGEHHRAPPSAV